MAPPTLGVSETGGGGGGGCGGGDGGDTAKALHLISGFQYRGHESANIDPLGLRDLTPKAELLPSTFGFTEDDWERELKLNQGVQNVSGLMKNADVNNDGMT